MWRNYANSDGFAIGIDAGVELSADGYVLDPDDEDTDPREDVPPINGWYQVHYTDQKKRMPADDFVASAIKDIRKTSAIHLPELVSELRKQTLILASTMKHKAFRDEKEVRARAQEGRHVFMKWLLRAKSSLKSKLFQGNFSMDSVL
ncbi:hypothetical protein QFZ23_002065 [Arthrobacter globiformis]|uniref:DUF2971 domain-containing protein n=1 Tax=Arthrobacter globiformis TaxID=1665 RepID=UPI00278A8FD3|nr:DUF2971 domain-containing protein [Arthrobacter globiformis]MDQ1058164.1 hypothetical protein [Arthrobacter globiformis]